jgi:hypothetical protein
VFGIVVDYSGVRSTRGTDKFCRLAILDASTSEPLDVMCFSTDPARLRHDLVLGDVVRAHALNIREHNSNVQAFMQHRSTIVVFNRDDRVVMVQLLLVLVHPARCVTRITWLWLCRCLPQEPTPWTTPTLAL